MLATILLMAGLAAAPGARGTSPVTMVAQPDTIRADGALTWNVPLRITNGLSTGFYLDSLWLEVTSRDPGAPGTPSRRRIDAAPRVLPTVGAGEAEVYAYVGPAECEYGDITFRLSGHAADGRVHQLTARAVAAGGVLTDAYPSRMVQVETRDVETIVAEASGAADSVPGVLLLVPAGSAVRSQLLTVHTLAQRGYHVVAVGLPGSGRSTGASDAAGAQSLGAASAAHLQLGKFPRFDASRVAAWGVDEGASTALLYAARHPELRAVVAVSGIYDWAAAFRRADEPTRKRWRAAAGADTSAWSERSPLRMAATPRGSVLLVHGEQDGRSTADEARAYARKVEAAGGSVEERYVATGTHLLLPRDVARPAQLFLQRVLGR